MSSLWPWIVLALLGVYHGINPGMGWLFAVSLGLQERSRSAVLRAFTPIAIGHFVSIAAVVALVAALRTAVSPDALRYTGAVALIGFGAYKLFAPMSHPRWVGMRVGSRQLALWSFLMATAHGAGLMVVPVVLKMDSKPAVEAVVEAAPAAHIETASIVQSKPPSCHVGANQTATVGGVGQTIKSDSGGKSNEPVPACHAQVGKMAGSGGAGVIAAMAGVGLHTLAMFLAMAGIALIVYDRIGLKVLRTAWVNLDLIWAVALIAAGGISLCV